MTEERCNAIEATNDLMEEKKKVDTKALLEQARKAKTQQSDNRFIKKSGSKRDKDECRRVNFNR